jgi:hypothetical protein
MFAKVGRLVNQISGNINPFRSGQNGELITAFYGGRYGDAALAGRLFHASMQTPATTSTTLNTTFVGLGLCNPSGSGKIVVLHEFFYACTAALTAAACLALASTTDSGFAADIVPRNCRFGVGPASACYADKSATIIAPVIERIVCTLGTSAATAMGSAVCPNVYDVGGSIILQPGRAIVTDTTVATGAVMQFGYLWEEIPIE